MSDGSVYRFGDFELDLAAECLSRRGQVVALAPQPFALLRMLVENRERLVTREEVQRVLWSDRVVDYDQGLNFCIRQLRTALGDAAADPAYGATVARRGYRFVAEVEHIRAGRTMRIRRLAAAAVAAAAAIVLVGGGLLALGARPRPVQMMVEPVTVTGVVPGTFVADALVRRVHDDLEAIAGLRVVDRFDPGPGDRLRLTTLVQALGPDLRLEMALVDVTRESPIWTAIGTARLENLLTLEQDLRRDLLEIIARYRAGDADGEQSIVAERTGSTERRLPAEDAGPTDPR